MTKNRIQAIAFDQRSFPLSPHYTWYDIYEEARRYVLVAHDKKVGAENDFVCVFSDDEEGFSPLLVEGRYYLTARMDGDPSCYVITFGFLNLETGQTIAETEFDATRYYLDYQRQFENAALHLVDPETRAKHEYKFSTIYLKRHFANLITGNDAFWNRLHGEIDMATAPHNFRIHAAQTGMKNLPVEVIDGKSWQP